MSAASQAKRISGRMGSRSSRSSAEHTASYSACGIPYWVAGDIDEPERLIARSPDAHRRNGIDLRMRTAVEEIDLQAGRVVTSQSLSPAFVPGKLRLPRHRHRRGPGPAAAARGGRRQGVFGVQTLDDGAALLADLDRAQPRRAVVVGGGYIGVEMAEALVRRGIAVTVVDQAAQPMTTLDPDMGAAVHRAMEHLGMDVRTDTAVTGFETGTDRRIRSVVTADGSIPANVVVLGLGVRPDTALATVRPAAGRSRRLAHQRADAGPRPRQCLGRWRLRGGPEPGLWSVPACAARHPRQQAGPGHRAQSGRSMPHFPGWSARR